METLITGKSFDNGVLNIEVLFTDNENIKFYRTFGASSAPDDKWLKEAINSTIKNIEEVKAFEKKVSLGAFDSTITKPEKTSKEIFREDFSKAMSYKNAIDFGLIDANNKTYVDLITKLIAEFQESYLQEI